MSEGLALALIVAASLVTLAVLLRPRKLKDRQNVHDDAWKATGIKQLHSGYDQRLAFQKARAARRKSETGRTYRKPAKPKGAEIVPMPKRDCR